MAYISLTERIYIELTEGINKGLDWDELLRKYGKSKGPLYGAFSRFIVESQGQIEKLVSEIKQKGEKDKELDSLLGEKEKRSNQLDEEITNKESLSLELEGKNAGITERLDDYEKQVKQQEHLLSSLRVIEESGFSPERLKELGERLKEMETEHGLGPGQAVGKFFDDLKLWGRKLALEAEIAKLDSEKERKGRKLEQIQQDYQGKEAAVEAIIELKEHGVGARRIGNGTRSSARQGLKSRI